MTQTVPTSPPLLPGEDAGRTPITVLHVGGESGGTDHLGARLGRDDQICVETVACPASVPTHLDSVDCVVTHGDLGDDDVLALLAAIREREPTLPFVVLASDPPQEVVDALCETPWTACLRVDGDVEQVDLIVQRIHDLVGYRRVTALAHRALAAVEQGSDAIAIVAPDGTLEFVDPLFARQFGSTSEELVGRRWRELFPDPEVRRLESDAFPSLADGWRWVGDCEIRNADGTIAVAQIRIDALDDDSLVFTVSDRLTGRG